MNPAPQTQPEKPERLIGPKEIMLLIHMIAVFTTSSVALMLAVIGLHGLVDQIKENWSKVSYFEIVGVLALSLVIASIYGVVKVASFLDAARQRKVQNNNR